MDKEDTSDGAGAFLAHRSWKNARRVQREGSEFDPATRLSNRTAAEASSPDQTHGSGVIPQTQSCRRAWTRGMGASDVAVVEPCHTGASVQLQHWTEFAISSLIQFPLLAVFVNLKWDPGSHVCQ